MRRSLLVTLADEKYIEQAKQLFSAAYHRAGWQGDCLLLAQNISEKQISEFTKKGILVRQCEPIFSTEELNFMHESSGKFRPSEFMQVAINKMHLFSIEYKQWKNIVYLDIDILIRGSLEELAGVKGFWAVQDMDNRIGGQFMNPEHNLWQKLKDSYDLNQRCFNSGVMAFSTDLITEKTKDELRELFKEYNPIRKTVDQSIFNLYFYRQWNKLNIIYNTFKPFMRIDSPSNRKAVIHFAGPFSQKPWVTDSPYYSEWRDNLQLFEKVNFKNNPECYLGISKIDKFLAFIYFQVELIYRRLMMRMACLKSELKKLFAGKS